MLDSATAWAINSPVDEFWKLTIALIILSLAGFAAAFYYLIRIRIMQDTPTAKVRSAAQGYTELIGHGELIIGETIKGPLTGNICTWFSYRIEEYRRSSKRSHWITVEHGESDGLFLLVDDTGRVLIDPEGAEVIPSITDIWHGHTRFPENYRGSKMRRWYHLGLNRYRYTEKRMHPGDPLYAIGLFITRGGDRDDMDVNNDVRELLREWKQHSETLLEEHDLDKNGELDIDEWEEVRKRALEEVLARHAELRRIPPVNTMGKTGDTRRPYVLSAVTESRLLKRLTRYSIFGITGFFLAGILAVWLIGIRLAQ